MENKSVRITSGQLSSFRKGVNVLCYNEWKHWDSRNDALAFYRECADCSEGSERERYVNILFGIMDGRRNVSDSGCFTA